LFALENPVTLIIIAVVVIVLFGGNKLAGLGKSAGEGLREFKKALKDPDEPDKPDEAKKD
jgi:sec-independent protein translocase protein TatA